VVAFVGSAKTWELVGVSHPVEVATVATAADRAALDVLLAGIAADSGLPVLDVPLEREYHIDLGFALHGEAAARTPLPPSPGLLTLLH
jgi:hypothetical protein